MAMVHALLMLMFLFFNVKQSVCEPRTTEAAPLICSNRIAPTSVRQIFVANFLAAMDSLTQQVSRQKYGVAVNGTGNNTVYAFGECMKDLSQNDCNLCFAEIKTRIIRCFPFQRLIKGGRLFYDGCYIRYDDYMFFNESLSFSDRVVCGVSDFGGNQGLFKVSVGDLVKNMSLEGPKNDGFFTGFLNNGNLTVYGLAQCWEVVNGSGCRNCLEKSVLNLSSCTPKTEGRVLNAGCYLRYSTTRFYNNSGNDESNGSGGSSRRQTTILASISGAVAFLLSVATVSFFFRKKMLQQRRVKKQLGPLWGTVIKSKLNFSYETLERATNYFHESNKLGQGGSGSVYKGILPGGQMVAVKRLFFNTTQWVDHFFNEVNLISGIEHKNLVKLLGCSITGPESLLVYEYVPNQSLHDYLFVRKDVPRLSWEEQYRIVLGIAEGLAYLHEESKLRIIHRDIKLSNVLLDKDLMPKIADFGLARLFPEDETHISTAIAGTLGYIAPEYMVRGKLTEKVDVYSFGVLVIEFVCGKKNYSSQNSHSILQKVWKLYEVEKLSEAVHHSLENKFHEEEVLKVLQIGLICVQASAELRPSMSIAVKMLTENHGIPRPTQPPFLNPSNAEVSPSNQPGVYFSQSDANTQCSVNETTDSLVMPR